MSALDIQIGGEHYKTAKIQPVQYIEANGLLFLEGCVVKRVTRHDKPTGKGRQDIEKAIHELQLLLELRYGEPAPAVPRSCPFCSAEEGSLHHPDCHLMRRSKSRLAAGDLHPDFAAALREKGFVQVAVASINGQTGDVVLEPAAQIDDESDRQKAVEQNGNDGAVYEDPWYGAPEWARFKAQDDDGEWFFYSHKPEAREYGVWARSHERGNDCMLVAAGEPNPNWRDTLIERTSG